MRPGSFTFSAQRRMRSVFGWTPRPAAIARGELLKDTDRVGGAQHRDGARQTNATGACSGGAENDRRRRIQVLLTVVLADPKDIQTDLVRMLNLFNQVAQPL